MPKGNNPFNAGAYIRELVNALPNGGTITFDEIWAAFLARGWDVTAKARIYASTQQEATKGTISRALAKQTFCKNNDAPKEDYLPIRKEIKPAIENVNSVTKRSKQVQRQKEVAKESVFDYLTDQLGPKSPIPTDHGTYRFLLVGDKTGEQIIGLYIAKYQQDPVHWCVYESENDDTKYYHVGLWS